MSNARAPTGLLHKSMLRANKEDAAKNTAQVC
jgi:hypothetical protein